MPKAAASTRALNKDITLSFGLVSIPVNLFSGTVSGSTITRNEFLPVPVTEDDGNGGQRPVTRTVIAEDGGTATEQPVYEDHPVGRGLTDKVTGDLLTEDEKARMVKKIATEYGPVYVEDGEIEKLFTLEPDTLKINSFQPQHLFHAGEYVPEKVMHIEPVKTGSGKKKDYNPAVVRVFGTLLKAMRTKGVIAVGELTTRGVPKPVILSPDGSLWQVWHTNLVREKRELPQAVLADNDVTMMGGLIDTMHTDKVTDLSDTRSELIQNFADEKAAAGDFDKVADTHEPTGPAEVSFDLSAMLAASIEQAKAKAS